ncbi:hypothetical protein OIO90_006046 [Microbotryomycetes sp. JL221]|nr:hypothetical protein OIO90_006046 [Microbotryomycetes sp. JL221]
MRARRYAQLIATLTCVSTFVQQIQCITIDRQVVFDAATDDDDHLAARHNLVDQVETKAAFEGWYDVRKQGGQYLNRAVDWGLGEPLNIIISNRSSPDVLRENGFVAYSRSLGLWQECANLHLGRAQHANLGDGQGGNHFRAWKQNGTLAPSGAWMLAASLELDVRDKHRISRNGYNRGRDIIVNKAIKGTKYLGRRWTTTVEWIEGLLEPGSDGVNHGIAQDGRIAVLTAIEF